MKCEELNEMFELYALGALEGAEKDEIDAHLGRGCQACVKSHQDALAVNALVMSMVPSEAPPARLKRRVLAGAGVERAGWGWLGALSAAGMLAVALWLGVQERQRYSDLVLTRDQLAQATTFLNQPETVRLNFGRGQPATPRGNVFIHVRLGILLVASNLPPLGSGKTYEMWIIPKGGAPRPAGLFQVGAQATAMHILAEPVDTSTLGAVAVTVEPEAGSTAPTTQPIIMAEAAGL